MTGEEVRKLTDAEIRSEIRAMRAAYYKLRTQSVTEKVEDVSKFGKLRKDIARLVMERTNRLKAKTAKHAPAARPAAAPAKVAGKKKPAAKATTAREKTRAPRKTKAKA